MEVEVEVPADLLGERHIPKSIHNPVWRCNQGRVPDKSGRLGLDFVGKIPPQKDCPDCLESWLEERRSRPL